MEFIDSFQKRISTQVVRVLLKRPLNGVKPSELREAINLGPALGLKTRRDGLCVAFNATNFEQRVAEFKSLNEATLNKYNVKVVLLSKRPFNIVITYIDLADNDQLALFKTMLKCDKVTRLVARGKPTLDLVASYSYLSSEERNSSSKVYAQNFCIKCRSILMERTCSSCNAQASPSHDSFTPSSSPAPVEHSESTSAPLEQVSDTSVEVPTEKIPPTDSCTTESTPVSSNDEDAPSPPRDDENITISKEPCSTLLSSSEDEHENQDSDSALKKRSKKKTTKKKTNTLINLPRKPDSTFKPPPNCGNNPPDNSNRKTRSSSKANPVNHLELDLNSRASIDIPIPAQE